MSDYLERSKQLLGDETISNFGDKTIVVIGIGGVGGTALESLARSGFKKFVIIDSDKVDVTNLNRQVLFTTKNVGENKVDAAANHLREISNEIVVEKIVAKVGDNKLDDLLKSKPDFIVDAIDFVEGKLDIFEYCLSNNIPFVSSLGMGNRIDPEQVLLTTLNKTEGDPLAKKIRYEAKQRGIDLKKVNVVFSKEVPIIKSPKPSSMMMVPSTAGLLITKYIVSTMK
ncbi:MAG: ThiF family adenylyltransferase [Firmicutes bacterium]|nr:ThiF family adenylyltransferase [Candidatus Fiminaster equi]